VRPAVLILAAAALALCVGVPVAAEVNQDGDLQVVFEGAMRPAALPREGAAPVTVRVAGDIRSAASGPDTLPQLLSISVAINREGRLFDRGLPICPIAEVQPATERNARRECRGAIVGSGHVRLRVRLPNQPPFPVRANLLAFNGPRRNGRKLIYAQAYAGKPPGAFVLTFRIDRRPGVLGTVMSTTLPPAARRWAYLTHFDMALHRTYWWHGASRSYVSAGCPAPPGFRSVEFPLAAATYGFADGRSLGVSTVGRCRVRG